jgi:predicted nucleic acid-binding protein
MRIALHYHRQPARLRARRSSIRLTDAVHIATAQALSCGFFVSRDRRLQTLEGIRMLADDPFPLDDILGSKPS